MPPPFFRLHVWHGPEETCFFSSSKPQALWHGLYAKIPTGIIHILLARVCVQKIPEQDINERIQKGEILPHDFTIRIRAKKLEHMKMIK